MGISSDDLNEWLYSNLSDQLEGQERAEYNPESKSITTHTPLEIVYQNKPKHWVDLLSNSEEFSEEILQEPLPGCRIVEPLSQTDPSYPGKSALRQDYLN